MASGAILKYGPNILSDQDYQVETVFSIKVHYYPDPSPNEQKSNQEDFCLSIHHHHHILSLFMGIIGQSTVDSFIRAFVCV